jgi:hypothetical protein
MQISALLQNFKILIRQLADSGFKIFGALNFTIFRDSLKAYDNF